MKTIKAKWTGIRPLILHNGLLADPTNPYVRAIKEITSKGSKKMTDDDYDRLDRLKWEGGLYWDKELGLYIPPDNIERCILEGAKKARKGKDMSAAGFLADQSRVKLDYKGPRDLEKLWADPQFQFRKGVVINRSRVISVRPIVPTGWSVSFTFEYDETILNEESVRKAMIEAGALVGLGDWRPKFGRFTVDFPA